MDLSCLPSSRGRYVERAQSPVQRHFFLLNKPGPAQVGAISKAQNSKRTSKCQFTVLENQKNRKNGPSGTPRPASASPWRAKRGTLPKLSTFLSQLKGPFGEKTNFRKKSHNVEKLKGGPFENFKHPICCKISKKLKRGPFGEKKLEESLTMPKN